MGITKAIARDIPVNSVNFVEYYYRTTTEGEVPTTVHHVVVKVNKHVYVGEYSADSEANAFLLAQDVVKGLLIKNGCTRPDSRILTIKFKKYNFPAPLPLTDPTPNPTPNWGNITFQLSGPCPPEGCNVNSGQQITGIDVPIDLYLTYARLANPGDQPWVKVTSTYNASDAAQSPSSLNGWTMVAQNALFTVTNNQWVWFATQTTDTNARTLTVKNATDNDTILDTFTQVYIPG